MLDIQNVQIRAWRDRMLFVMKAKALVLVCEKIKY